MFYNLFRRLFIPTEENQNIRVDETAGIPTRRICSYVNENKNSLLSFTVQFLFSEQMPADRRLAIQSNEELLITYMLIICMF